MIRTGQIVEIASHLSSRLCHDLGNTLGAINTGLGVFEEDGVDPDLQKDALALVQEGLAKSIAVLELSRIAFGSSGGLEGDLDMVDAARKAQGFFAHSKATLDWQVAAEMMPKWKGRVLLNALIAMERSVPRADSRIVAADAGDGLRITATGPKVKANEELLGAFAGKDDALAPKDMPAFLAALIAETGGMKLSTDFVLDDHLTVVMEPA